MFFFISAVVLALANNLAVSFSLYWQYLWLDIPMHALGGIVAALGFLSFFAHHLPHKKRTRFFVVLLAVLFVGIAWEVFEYFNGIGLTREKSIIADTALDLVMDLVGGVIAFFVAERVATLDSRPDIV